MHMKKQCYNFQSTGTVVKTLKMTISTEAAVKAHIGNYNTGQYFLLIFHAYSFISHHAPFSGFVVNKPH
jgi:hypothetical protein